jgi:short-subunit dehydrogenase
MTTKKALITGASGGIGLALARALAKEGYQITAVARQQPKLDALVKELGAGHRALAADLATSAGIDAVSAELKATRYDLLVNNAGAGLMGAFADSDLKRSRELLTLNCDAVVALSHAFLAGSRPGDALMNVSSTLGLGTFPYSSVYAATKAFVLSFSEGVWFEQKDRGVYVVALCPGATESDFHASAGASEANRPPKRIMETPEQVAATAVAALAERSGPSVISGPKNKVMAFVMTRILGRKRGAVMMGGFGKPK